MEDVTTSVEINKDRSNADAKLDTNFKLTRKLVQISMNVE
jgi:hypothetical protein